MGGCAEGKRSIAPCGIEPPNVMVTTRVSTASAQPLGVDEGVTDADGDAGAVAEAEADGDAEADADGDADAVADALAVAEGLALAVGAVVALVFGVRLWWTLRKLKRAGGAFHTPPASSGDTVVEGEFQVVERESHGGTDRGRPRHATYQTRPRLAWADAWGELCSARRSATLHRSATTSRWRDPDPAAL